MPEVRVSPFGPMHASCIIYGCSSRTGMSIDLSGLEVRLCRTHIEELDRQLHVRGDRRAQLKVAADG